MRKSILFIMIVALTMPIMAQINLGYGLEACYPFTGNAGDSSGYGHHGTVGGATLTQDRHGNPNSAYLFDGTDDYIDVTGVIKSKSEFAISFWSKTNQFKNQMAFCLVPDQLTDRIAVHVNYNFNGDTMCLLDFGDATNGGRWGNDDMPNMNTNWEHYVYMSSATKDSIIIYRDNQMVAGDKTHSVLNDTNRTFRIGGRLTNTNLFFNGAIDDVKIWSRALSRAEVAYLYNLNSSTCNLPITGIDKQKEGTSFQLSPNPCDGDFRVTFPKMVNETIQMMLIDITGKVVWRSNVYVTASVGVSVPDLSNGVYTLLVSTEGASVQSKKLVINR